jgi:hypothetical protein
VKDKNSEVRLMGFGHRVYKNYDPRAKIMRDASTGRASRDRARGDRASRDRASHRDEIRFFGFPGLSIGSHRRRAPRTAPSDHIPWSSFIHHICWPVDLFRTANKKLICAWRMDCSFPEPISFRLPRSFPHLLIQNE